MSNAAHMNTSKFLRRKEWRSEISKIEQARLTLGSYEEARYSDPFKHILRCLLKSPVNVCLQLTYVRNLSRS